MKAIHNGIEFCLIFCSVVANLLKVKNESNSQQVLNDLHEFLSCGKSTKSKEWKQFTTIMATK